MKFMIVGESPSHTRPKGMEAVAFSGRTSHYLWDELKKYDIQRKNCVVTNIVEELLPKGNKPNKDMIKKNVPRIFSLAKENEISLILTMGRLPTEALLDGKYKMRDAVGNIIPHKDLWIVPCIHPGAVARSTLNKVLFKKSIRTAMFALEEITKLHANNPRHSKRNVQHL